MSENEEEKILLAHHEQQPLCTTRLPYRQGRKLTAVKVYTVNDESAHLLVFNVPTLNLRQETKSLFSKFGKILQFNLKHGYKTEKFTEVYHVLYQRIQSARFAKKMTDGKEFYGEILHVCYAPEFETLEETKDKLYQRNCDVLKRLNSINVEVNTSNTLDSECTEKQQDINLLGENVVQNQQNYAVNTDYTLIHNEVETFSAPVTSNTNQEIVKFPVKYIEHSKKLYMGEENTIYLGKRKRKREKELLNLTAVKNATITDNIEVVDCTDTEKEIVSNINEHLNYDNFGNEIIKKIPIKPVNRIKFNKKD